MKTLLAFILFGIFLTCNGATDKSTSQENFNTTLFATDNTDNTDNDIFEEMNDTDFVEELLNLSVPLINDFFEIFSKTAPISPMFNDLNASENPLANDFTNATLNITAPNIVESLLSNLFNTLYNAAKMIDPNIETMFANQVIDQIMNVIALATEVIDNEACKGDLKLYSRDLTEGQIWAIKMFDATAKFPAGVLMGNLFEMGNFDECVEIDEVESISGDFRGQYCIAEFIPGRRLKENLISKLLPKQAESLTNLSVTWKWSLCVPSSCRSRDVEAILQHLRPNILSDVTIKVDESMCTTSATKVFRPIDWFAVGVLALSGILVVLSTTFDLVRSPDSPHRLLVAFSLYTNGKSLLSTKTNEYTLPAVHGIRLLSILWVVYGHRYLVALTTPSVNSVVFLDYASDWGHGTLIISALMCVDTFFLMSGFLVCYLLLRALDSGVPFNVPLIYFYRYIRLTPPYAIMILLSITLFNYVGNGPQWERVMGDARTACEENWWTNLIYLNNYINPTNLCLGPSWYLSADTQLFWISPLMIYSLWRWPMIGKCLLLVLFACGLVISFLGNYINEIGGSYAAIFTNMSQLALFFTYIYFPTHMRFTPYLVGIGLGYMLHHTRHTTVQLSKWVVTLAWLVCVMLFALPCYYFHYVQQPGYQYDRVFESVAFTLGRPGWALSVAWIIFACAKGYGGVVDTFLKWKFFHVLSRLSYGVYLTHYPVYTMMQASGHVPLYIGDSLIVEQYGVLVVSFAASLVLSLVFESPSIIIGKCLMEKYFLHATTSNVNDQYKASNGVGKTGVNLINMKHSLSYEEDTTADRASRGVSVPSETDKDGFLSTELTVCAEKLKVK